MHITVLNGSTKVTNDQAAEMTAAVSHQVHTHVAPAWALGGRVSVSFHATPPKTPPANVLTIVDAITDEPAGVLGYHTEDTKGTQFGVVAAGPVLDAGKQVLTGDWSVASILSHEVIEWLADPACNLWAFDGTARFYPYEACDPCEAPTYLVDGVSVSNFVLPAWFDTQAKPGTERDHLGLIPGAFQLLPGGYAVYVSAGREHQVYGDQFPAWRKAMKAGPAARTRRRIVQGSSLGF